MKWIKLHYREYKLMCACLRTHTTNFDAMEVARIKKSSGAHTRRWKEQFRNYATTTGRFQPDIKVNKWNINRISTRQLHTAEVATRLARFCQEFERFPLIGESISAKSFRMRLLEVRIIGNQLTTWYRLRSNKLHGTRYCRFNIEREKHLIRLNCKMLKDIHSAYQQ